MISQFSNVHCIPRTLRPSSTFDVSHDYIFVGFRPHPWPLNPTLPYVVQGMWVGRFMHVFSCLIALDDALLFPFASPIVICHVSILYAEQLCDEVLYLDYHSCSASL